MGVDGRAEEWIEGMVGGLKDAGAFKEAVYMNYAKRTEGFKAMYGGEEWRQERLVALKRK